MHLVAVKLEGALAADGVARRSPRRAGTPEPTTSWTPRITSAWSPARPSLSSTSTRLPARRAELGQARAGRGRPAARRSAGGVEPGAVADLEAVAAERGDDDAVVAGALVGELAGGRAADQRRAAGLGVDTREQLVEARSSRSRRRSSSVGVAAVERRAARPRRPAARRVVGAGARRRRPSVARRRPPASPVAWAPVTGATSALTRPLSAWDGPSA